jgi:hypothetical protein
MVRGEESPYSQPAIDQLRAKFREAVPLLEFTTETPTVSKETLREEVIKALEEEKLKEIAAKYHVPIEQVRTVMRSKAKNLGSYLRNRRPQPTGAAQMANIVNARLRKSSAKTSCLNCWLTVGLSSLHCLQGSA